jgi:TolB-like protein
MSFWDELKRRNVVKVGAAYAIVGWLLVQIASDLFPALQLPPWTVTFVAVLLILGFPIALLLAWAYELTPDGIQKTRQVPLEESIRNLSGQKLNYLVTGLLVAAIGFLLVDNYVLDDDASARPGAGQFSDAAVDTPPVDESGPSAARGQARLEDSIAVLPFDSLSESVEDAHFAAGLHDEVLNQLAKLRSLNVISRSSVLRYTETRPAIREVAAELNVETVMEGTVRYAGNQLVVSAQLIDAERDVHLWSDTFRADRSNVEEILSIQVDIATAIANALGATISPEDRSRIERMPTDSAAAYARYLRAQDHYGETEFVDALREIDLAIELDPEFAEAYARRAVIYAYGQVTANARIAFLEMGRADDDFQALAVADADRALAIYEGAALAWIARAVTDEFHYRWNDAERAFAKALELSPNDPTVLHEYALFRMNTGDIAGALELIDRAVPLDPNGALTLCYWARIAAAAGREEDVQVAVERCVAANPSHPYQNMVAGQLARDRARAERYLRTAEALAIGYQSVRLLGIARGFLRIGLEGDATRVLDRYAQIAEDARVGMGDWALYYLERGDADRAYAALRSAVESLEAGQADAGFNSLETFAANPSDPRLAEQRFQDLLERLQALRAD